MAKNPANEKSNKGLGTWVRERLAVSGLDYEVPKHANTLLFSLGGITLISFIILIVTGVILAQFYTASPDTANQSIRVLMTEVKIGALIRGIHFWAAQIAMVTVILHLLRVFIYGSYKRPREINWLLGVGLFFGMMGLYYTGTILKWDQEAFEALAHTQAAAKLVGVFGFMFADSFAKGVPLLTRMFSLHTSVLPLLVIGLLAGHLLLVKLLQISPLPWNSGHNGSKEMFSRHLKKLVGYGFVLTGAVMILAVFLPPKLGAVPVAGIEATKPPWLFLSIFSIENWAGLPGLLGSAALLALALIAVPFVDRAVSNNLKQRKAIVTLGAVAVLLAFGLTINAYVAKPEQHIGMGEETEQAGGQVSTADDQTNSGQADNQAETGEDEQATLIAAQLDNALAVISEIQSALDGQNLAAAAEKAAELDEVFDAIADKIAAKDSDAAADIEEHVHELGEILEKPQPDAAEASNLLGHSRESIEAAVKLFQ